MLKRILSFYLAMFLALPAAALAEESEGTFPDYTVLPVEAGDIVPFEGVLLSLDAAAKILTEKKFEDAECDLRLEYELNVQEENYELLLSYKDIEITSWTDKYESMMILKTTENERLYDLVTKTKPGSEPFMVALGFGIGTLTSLGIFALSTEIVRE
tara:strand:- start:166 stop:636 length:471 start_codon:yes stop_codon:yes gene_type:complete